MHAAPYSPSLISNPCSATIDKATVESIVAARLEDKCRGSNPPEECPNPEDEEDAGVPRSFVPGFSGVTAFIGAILILA